MSTEIPTTPLHYYVMTPANGILMDTHTMKHPEAVYWAKHLGKFEDISPLETPYSVIATSREISV